MEYLPDTVSRERIAQAIREAGYEPAEQEQAPDATQARQARELVGPAPGPDVCRGLHPAAAAC